MKTSLQRRPLLEVLKESELDIFWLEGRFVAQVPSPLLLLERDHAAAVIAVAVALGVDAAAAGAVGVVGALQDVRKDSLASSSFWRWEMESLMVQRNQLGETRWINWSFVLPPRLLLLLSSAGLCREPAALRVLLACLHAWLGCLARGLLW